MKNTLFYTLAALILFIIYRHPATTAHSCSFTNCPYKGLSGPQSHRLNMALNDSGTDSYCIDSLHLVMPTADYDTIDSLLFDNQ